MQVITSGNFIDGTWLKAITFRMKDIFFSEWQDREIRCCMLLMEFMLTLFEYRKELSPELTDEDRIRLTECLIQQKEWVTSINTIKG